MAAAGSAVEKQPLLLLPLAGGGGNPRPDRAAPPPGQEPAVPSAPPRRSGLAWRRCAAAAAVSGALAAAVALTASRQGAAPEGPRLRSGGNPALQLSETTAGGDCLASSTLRWAAKAGKCVAVDNSEKSLGSRLYLWDCLADFPHQLFVLPAPGTAGPLKWAAQPEKCVDVQDGSTANGAHLQLWTCFNGNSNQEFIVPKGGGPVRWAKHPDRCLSVLPPGTNVGNGDAIGLWQCSTGSVGADLSFSAEPAKGACAGALSCAQMGEAAVEQTEVAHAINGVPIQLFSSRSSCMTVRRAGRAGGLGSIEVWKCAEEQEAQQLFLIPAGGSGPVRWAANPERCLEAAIGTSGRALGAPLRLGSCQPSQPAQLFELADFAGPIRWGRYQNLCVSLRLGSACDGNDFVLRDCGHGIGPGLKFAIHAGAPALPPELRDGYARGDVLYTNSESSVSFKPEVGNGLVATVAGSNAVFVAGVFNGCMKDSTGKKCQVSPSRRARIPAPLALNLDAQTIGAALDLRGASFMRFYKGGLRLRFYAHRARKALLVVELSSSPPEDGGQDAEADANGTEDARVAAEADTVVLLGGGSDTPESGDFVWSAARKVVAGTEVLIWSGQAKESELPEQMPTRVAVVLPKNVGGRIELAKGSTVAYFAALRTSLDSADPEADAVEDWRAATLVDAPALYREHEAAWAQLWRSGFEVSGRLDVAKTVNASLYYLLSSLREDEPYSLSPGGLASNAYLGHTFWDTEMWMLPTLSLWHPELSASLLEYRVRRVDQARAKAQGYHRNYSGAMYAWESAATGAEECPTWANTGQLEQHISADLAFAQQQLWHATHNRSQLAGAYRALLAETADFWVSRVEWDGGVAHIRKVVPPDEFHIGNDSVYTNFVVQRNLRFAAEAAAILGEKPNPEWTKTAEKIPILFDRDRGIHPEYAGYDGGKIKQADVVLLGFPLLMNMSKATRRADLEYYATRAATDGPAMTWGMHAIGRMEIGELQRASEDFNRSFANAQKPFYVWTETPTGGAVNFLTGAGGFLQATMYGLAGIRILPDRLELSPSLLDGMESIVLRGLHYRGSVFTVSFDAKSLVIYCEAGAPILVQSSLGLEATLPPGGRAQLQFGPAAVRPAPAK